MSDMRIKYGLALGPYGTVGTTSSQNLLPPGDTTPDISGGSYFLTANTSATTITYFDGRLEGGLPGVEEGKIIFILFRDSNTTISNGANLVLADTGGAFQTGQTLMLIHSNSSWFEVSRGAGATGGGMQTITVGGTIAPNVAGINRLVLLTTAATTLIGLSGGTPGQTVIINQAIAAAGTAFTITGAAQFFIAGTSTFVANNSAAYQFYSDNGSRFRLIGGAVVP